PGAANGYSEAFGSSGIAICGVGFVGYFFDGCFLAALAFLSAARSALTFFLPMTVSGSTIPFAFLPVPAGLGESCLALGAREPAFAGRWAPLVGDAALSLIARTSAIDRLRVGFFATFDSTRVTPCFFASRL